MTSLEQALASILELIEKARGASRNRTNGRYHGPFLLAALMQRKDTICAALAAPEQH